MKLKPFKEIICIKKEKFNEELSLCERRIKVEAERKKYEIDEAIVEIESDVQEICSEREINFDRLSLKLDNIEMLERRKKQYDKFLGELFPDENS